MPGTIVVSKSWTIVASGSADAGGYGGRGLVGLPIEELHSAIRDSRKPVIAKVQGYAIGAAMCWRRYAT
jgi:enoyl-CoA hydratase/carnithine racemase